MTSISAQLPVIWLGVISLLLMVSSRWLLTAITVLNDSWATRLQTRPLKIWLALCYYLGPPYLALINGWIPPRLFGFKGLTFFTLPTSGQPLTAIFNQVSTQLSQAVLTWLPDIGPAAAIGGLLGSVFLFYLLVYRQTYTPQTWPPPIYQSNSAIIFEVIHWSFYRAIFWLLSGRLYTGVVGGVAVILVELLLLDHLERWGRWRRQQTSLRFGIGLVTTTTFLFAPNMWLSILLQWVLVVLSNALLRGIRQSVATTDAP